MGEFLVPDSLVQALAALELIKNDIALVEKTIRKNSDNTHGIFQSQIASMKQLKVDIKTVKNDLLDVKKSGDTSSQTGKIADITELTHSILKRVDAVIENLQGFVSVLQSQDVLDQMLQGSLRVADSTMENGNSGDVPEGMLKSAKADFAKCYTIKEQRDFAAGVVSEEVKKKITIF